MFSLELLEIKFIFFIISEILTIRFYYLIMLFNYLFEELYKYKFNENGILRIYINKVEFVIIDKNINFQIISIIFMERQITIHII
jgi:hypothetical protein